MFARLLLLFILVPLADLVLLMLLSKYTGILLTIGLVVVSGIIGAWLAKQQVGNVGHKIRSQLSQNQLPAGLLTDGGMILFAAGLLITPGLITDVFGFSLLIPRCRQWYKDRAIKWVKEHFEVQVVTMNTQRQQQSDVVDGEVVSREDSTFEPSSPVSIDQVQKKQIPK